MYLIIPTLLKLVLAAFFYGSTDIVNFRGASEALLANHAIKQNYFAPILSALAAPRLLEDLYGIPFSFTFKALPILSELGIGYLIYRFSLTFTSSTKAKIITIFYLLHPINLYISVFHGQLDSVAMLLILLSFYLLTTRGHLLSTTIAAAFFSLAIGLKVFPVLLLPLVLALRQITWSTKLKFLILTGILLSLPALIYLPEILPFIDYFRGPLSYRSYGILGLDGVLSRYSHTLQLLYHNHLLVIILSVLSFSAIITYLRRLSLFDSLLLSLVGLLAFSTSLAPQYLVWLVPLLFLTRSTNVLIFSYCFSLFLPLLYLFTADNSGTFAALIPFSFLTPDLRLYQIYFKDIQNIFETYIRWQGLGYFLILWYFYLAFFSKSTANLKNHITFRLHNRFILIIFLLILAAHSVTLSLEYVTHRLPQNQFSEKLIPGSSLAQSAHMFYGHSLTRRIIVPASLNLKQIYIDGGSHLEVRLNNEPSIYYYGNQHWEYHGGWRNSRGSLPIELVPSVDNQLLITSNMSTIRPEYFINVATSSAPISLGIPPKILPQGPLCTDRFSGDCSFTHFVPGSWHPTIVEIITLLTLAQGYLFYRFRSILTSTNTRMPN